MTLSQSFFFIFSPSIELVRHQVRRTHSTKTFNLLIQQKFYCKNMNSKMCAFVWPREQGERSNDPMRVQFSDLGFQPVFSHLQPKNIEQIYSSYFLGTINCSFFCLISRFITCVNAKSKLQSMAHCLIAYES